LVEGLTEDEVTLLQRSFVAGLAQQLAAAGRAPGADAAPNDNNIQQQQQQQQQHNGAVHRSSSGSGSSTAAPNASAAAAAAPFSPAAGNLLMQQQITSAGLASPSPTPLSLAQAYAAAARGGALLSPPRGHYTTHHGADQQQQLTPPQLAPSGSLQQLAGVFSSPAGLQHPGFDLVQLLMSPTAQPHDLAAALQSPQQAAAAGLVAVTATPPAAAGEVSGSVLPGMGLATLPAASLAASGGHQEGPTGDPAAAAAAFGGTAEHTGGVLALMRGGVSAAVNGAAVSGAGSNAASGMNQAPGVNDAVIDDDDDVALVSGEGVPGLGGVSQQGRLGSVRLMPSLV
jgi:hypothetical protein